jgi:toxin ParE1/3/4
MTRVELAPQVAEDFDRILAFLAQHDAAAARVLEIMQAVEVLAHNPLIGRPVSNGKRELVIGRSSHGYVALYQYAEEIDTAFVLAVRSQREAGYVRT